MANPQNYLKLGFVGLSTKGWASSTIAPSLLDPEVSQHIKLVAVSTSRPETATASARKYTELTGSDVKPYYGDAEKIASDPDVDLIAVSVKAPYHKEVVEKAIAHGKWFFVEWPAGKSLEETREIARLAKERGVKSVVGLQGRQSKATLKVCPFACYSRVVFDGRIIRSRGSSIPE